MLSSIKELSCKEIKWINGGSGVPQKIKNDTTTAATAASTSSQSSLWDTISPYLSYLYHGVATLSILAVTTFFILKACGKVKIKKLATSPNAVK